jgi:hypothetical protein
VGNLPTAYKQLSKRFSYREKSPGRAENFVYIRVAILGDFSPKKANFGIFLKNVQGNT